MILVIAGTDRSNSNSRRVADYVQGLLKPLHDDVRLLDLADLKPTSHGGPHYGIQAPDLLHEAVELVSKADGLYVVCPEYNGSMPGALKFFIDHWRYPESFEFRPIALCGLGGMWGGLRPVEHLQGVFGYRNSYIYPERVFVRDVWKVFKDGDCQDPVVAGLFRQQAAGFLAFVKALKVAGIDANSINAKKAAKI